MMKMMHKWRWSWQWGLGLVVLVLALGAFAYNRSQVQANTGRIKVVFWHEMKGPGQKAIDAYVKAFNQQQSKYEVVAEFEGGYNGVIQKILNTHGTAASPALFQSMDISTSQMYHSGFTTPMQKFIDRDGYDASQIIPGAKAIVMRKDQLLAMPFNASQTALYYNKAVLRKYGITPPPVDPTYDDITRVAKAIHDKSHGEVKGMTMEAYSWLFEQLVANAGVPVANHDNGHTGNATKVDFTSPAAINAMKWVKENIDYGDFMNFGSGGNAAANEAASFLSGHLGIFMQSSAKTGQLYQVLKNDLGVTYFPRPNGQKANGIAVGGAALWIANDKPSAVQDGAWEFTKYLTSPKVQADWQAKTGYLAVNKDAKDEPTLKKLFKKSPVLEVSGNQMARTKPNNTNSGVFVDGWVPARTAIQNAMQQIFAGQDIRKSLQTAENTYNQVLESNNRANGRH
ncbi:MULTISPECIES: ABC transporter substrate-binding protein [Lactiplantibacillus]|jgi:sn-glycerol 3-phosphate transport system substrate-binding protein|uniref:ABC transporter substrate-binding protein n=3 Tax=Lactiplantibacillus pentosus TaxID=1589 RepID=A0A241RLH4_LACPE|nr:MULTISPECIES: ABC transporter substrate-binding protein [Lactiplantibacillus]MCH4130166.1 ABC transporter substrate-binding protein [Lactiplantibacillus sp.]BBM20471.1 glycerol-3-phosphate ABC transporter, substrate binding protein [Lactiplantibacillus plantarum]ASG78747.1 ABC transporter substrate-binding protein [Lactiplantibacillus pentosus]AYJ41535.1 ABC transporter substrate-binding protein [Lactiplantibacillus pentosus]KRK22820.1 sugar abc transporter, substrate binding protein [Lacti